MKHRSLPLDQEDVGMPTVQLGQTEANAEEEDEEGDDEEGDEDTQIIPVVDRHNKKGKLISQTLKGKVLLCLRRN